jgi:hypothetical protein
MEAKNSHRFQATGYSNEMDPPPQHRRTGDGSVEMGAKSVGNREWEMAWRIGHGAKRPETVKLLIY